MARRAWTASPWALSATDRRRTGRCIANYTYLDSEVLRNVSDYCLANPGIGACTGGNAADPDFVAGDPLLATPENAMSVWTTYDLSRKWQLGYGATYAGWITVEQHSASKPSGELATYGGYTTHRAMVAYRVNDAISACS